MLVFYLNVIWILNNKCLGLRVCTYRRNHSLALLFLNVMSCPRSTQTSSITSYITLLFSSAPTEYGKKHEKQAISAYKKLVATKKLKNPKITPTGLILCSHRASFGASTDSMLSVYAAGRVCQR